MVLKIGIVFEDDNFFFPGETVKGYVKVFSENGVLASDLKLKVVGSSKTDWTSKELTDNENVHHMETEEYYTLKYYLLGSGCVTTRLPAGTHQYRFEFVLPTGIPASFESQFGYVRHTCSAYLTVKNPTSTEYVVDKIFSVGATLDLNENPFAHEQITSNKEKTLCCLCCKGGQISLSLNVDHAGFVPGENMVINAECINESSGPTKATCAEVIQRVKYKSRSSAKVVENKICSKSHKATGPGNDDIWFGELLKIPPVPPSGLPGCSIIDIDYIFVFSFIPSGFSRRLSHSSELVIGSVPLRQCFSTFGAATSAEGGVAGQHLPPPPPYSVDAPLVNFLSAVPSAPQLGFDVAAPPPPTIPFGFALHSLSFPWAQLYPELAAPVYQTCVLTCHKMLPIDDGRGEERKMQGKEKVFVPRYVTYLCPN